jgi:hypothetical protein
VLGIGLSVVVLHYLTCFINIAIYNIQLIHFFEKLSYQFLFFIFYIFWGLVNITNEKNKFEYKNSYGIYNNSQQCLNLEAIQK